MLTVPVFLVFWKSSQFTPKGYLGFAMTFVFLELRPISAQELPIQFLAMVFCSALLIPALVLYARLSHRVPDPATQIEDSLRRLSQLLELLARQEGSDAAIRQELYDTAQKFHRLGYDRRRLFHLPDKHKRYYHLFALLFQRASYLVTDEAAWQEARQTPAFPQVMETLSRMVNRLQEAEDAARLEELSAELQGLLDSCDLPQGRLRIFYRSVLHMLLLLCREPLAPARLPFRLPPWQSLWTALRQRLSPNSFEFRFALRLAVVLTVSCTVSFLWDFEHTYWFPLHAFLLLQPSYEESAHRMVTRPVGTAIGCVLVHLVYPWLPGLPGVFVFSLLMIALMYCCTPGTWVHPIFSTSFALTMATLTVEKTEAIQLRLLYLAMAVALVLVVNRFLLPSRREQQFTRNLRSLFYLQAAYWRVVERSLREIPDPALFSELLAQFHMVYHEVSLYIAQLPAEEGAEYRTLQLTLWNMFSELEQVECLIQTGALAPMEYAPLETLAGVIRAQLSPPQASLADLSVEQLPPGELRSMLERYLQNARLLLTSLPKI